MKRFIPLLLCYGCSLASRMQESTDAIRQNTLMVEESVRAVRANTLEIQFGIPIVGLLLIVAFFVPAFRLVRLYKSKSKF